MPLITHPAIVEQYHWRTDLEVISKLSEIKRFSFKYKLRLSMHPDQFTVLNSLREDVVKKSIDFLKYHADFLSHVGGNDIIMHVGGVYGDKESAINRFILEYNKLSSHIKKYIRIENDDKSYHLIDIIEIYQRTEIPIIMDLHHHNCHNVGKITNDILKIVMNSWKTTPKIHLSSGKKEHLDRSHSDYIENEDIDRMNDILLDYVVDVMIEAKKKDLATLRVKKYIKERSYEKSIKTQNTD
jgi:UV DNA damage endonuclease